MNIILKIFSSLVSIIYLLASHENLVCNAFSVYDGRIFLVRGSNSHRNEIHSLARTLCSVDDSHHVAGKRTTLSRNMAVIMNSSLTTPSAIRKIARALIWAYIVTEAFAYAGIFDESTNYHPMAHIRFTIQKLNARYEIPTKARRRWRHAQQLWREQRYGSRGLLNPNYIRSAANQSMSLSTWAAKGRHLISALKNKYQSLPVRMQFSMGVVLGISLIRSFVGAAVALLKLVVVTSASLELISVVERIYLDENNGVLGINDVRIPRFQGGDAFSNILQEALDILNTARLTIRRRLQPQYIWKTVNTFADEEAYLSAGILAGSILGVILA